LLFRNSVGNSVGSLVGILVGKVKKRWRYPSKNSCYFVTQLVFW